MVTGLHLISGFPGIGKSHLYRQTPAPIPVWDLDSGKGVTVIQYLQDIQHWRQHGTTLLITTHPGVRRGLRRLNMRYILAYPTRDSRDMYLDRLIDRGSDVQFLDYIYTKWDKLISSCEQDCSGQAMHLPLRSNEYLSDRVRVTSTGIQWV